MNRKANASSFLVGAIITIVSFIVLAPIVANWVTGDECEKMETACEWSVGIRATTTLKIDKQDTHTTPLLCRTCDREIKDDKKEVMKKVADMMARCWWMFGEGRYEEIVRNPLLVKKGVAGLKTFLPEFGKNACFLCYATYIQESKGFKKGDKITYKEFSEYLINTTYKKVGKTYLEYIQSHGGPGRIILFGDIEPNHAYGISFAAVNQDPTAEGMSKKIGRAFIGTSAGATGVIYAKMGYWGMASPMLQGSVASDIYKKLYTERDVSTIYLKDLKESQKDCFSGDVGI